MRWLQHLWHRVKHSVRYKVLALVLLPLVLVMPLILAASVYWAYLFTYDQLFIKVNTDLAVARDRLMHMQAEYLQYLTSFGESHRFRSALKLGNQTTIHEQLQQLQHDEKFAYLQLLDLGQLDSFPDVSAARQSTNLQLAIRGMARTGIEIFTPNELRQINPKLEEQVRLPLLNTPHARPTQRHIEERGMLIRALYPIRDDQQTVIAILDAGVLLNGDTELVTHIRDIVYNRDSLPTDSIGRVSIFLEDVNISSSVSPNPQALSLGTRVSEAVRTTVLDQDKDWINRAFVINDWYISGYEAILDIDGRRVGMLYAGYLEAPFSKQLWQAVMLLLFLFIVITCMTSLLVIQGTSLILSPLEKMSEVIRATRKGEKQRIGEVHSRDEIGELAQRFDAMLELLQMRNEEISHWANQLEHKVDERTAELQQKNTDLQDTIQLLHKTRHQLVAAEKMAALGELTAGMAHEINNPVAVILGNVDVMVSLLGEQAGTVQPEIDLIIEQVDRIRLIIHNLLQYARPSDNPSLETVDSNELVEQTFKLIEFIRKEHPFEFSADYQAKRRIRVNAQELQQVLVNLLRNAIQALPEHGGIIQIKTRNWQNQGVVIDVCDNGSGISPEHIERIFDPFFTTKPAGQGTGLGLSLSYAMIHRYGGHISVESTPGNTCFSVYLLSKAQLKPQLPKTLPNS